MGAPDGARVRAASSPWVLLSGAIALLVVAPIAALAVAASRESPAVWSELFAYVLPPALRDTALLLGGVGLLAACIGTGAAWLVTAYDFPGRRFLDWALLLPLAVPTYIIAYAYLDVLHPIGPVQTALRALLGFDSPRDFRLPDIRSMTGCVVLLAFVLYPYVYLTTRAMFLTQAADLVHAARTLGAGGAAVFFRVALPLARPAVAVGVALALMETLNDVGAAEFLGVRTMTVSIYTTWITRSDLSGAARISLAMLVLVVLLVLLERWGRRHRRYAADARESRRLTPQRLGGAAALGALAAGGLPVAIGFLVPAVYLATAAWERARFAGISPAIPAETLHTVIVSLVATILTLLCAVLVVYAVRLGGSRAAPVFARAASLGYAVPGTVLAIGLLPVVTGVDALIDTAATSLWGISTGLLVLGSGGALVYAYAARFLAIGTGSVEAGFSRVPGSIDDAARTLGRTAVSRLWHVHLPLTRPALATAALLVFVDCMKELPATLLLRPVGVETLATHLYGEAIRGTYEEAAIAALLIVVVGLVPVVLLARVGRVAPRRDAALPVTDAGAFTRLDAGPR